MECDDLYEVETMSLYEYEARMYAYRLKELDKEYDIHLNAWLNNIVGSTNKDGKPKFKEFESFFDYKKKLQEIETGLGNKNIKPQHKRMANIAAEVNVRGG